MPRKSSIFLQAAALGPTEKYLRLWRPPVEARRTSQQAFSKSQALLDGQTVQQALELLFAQLDFVLQLALLDDERRLHLDKVLVVGHAVLGQVAGQDVVDGPLAPVQVVLQLLGVLVLPYQQLALLRQRALEGGKKKKKSIADISIFA